MKHKEDKVLPLDIKLLRKRHKITQKKLSESLYCVAYANVCNWESGKRKCPNIVFWAMVLTFDKVDLYVYGIKAWRRDFNMKKGDE